MSKNVLVIWDGSLISPQTDNHLKQKACFKELLLMASESPFHEIKDKDLDIIDRAQMVLDGNLELKDRPTLSDNENVKAWDSYSMIFILAELDWSIQPRSAFYGFEVLRKLRFAQIKVPVIMCSLLPKHLFYQTGELKFQILKAPGHFFMQLPLATLDQKEEDAIRPLSADLLSDINYHFLNYQGRVDELFHLMKGKVFGGLIASVKNSFSQLLPLLRDDNRAEFHQIQKSLISNLTGASYEEAYHHLADAKQKVKQLIVETEDQLTSHKKITNWSVLVIDDEAAIRTLVQTRFEAMGIHSFCAATGKQAFEILNKDYAGLLKKGDRLLPANHINLVVCDWRFQNELHEWHYYQGYEIIRHILNEFHNLLSFVVLTSKKGGIIRKVREQQQFHALWFAKEDVLASEGNFNFFAEQVKKEAQHNYEALLRIPQRGYWNKVWKGKIDYPLSDYYRLHRASAKYHRMEHEIAHFAESFIQAAEKLKAGSLQQKFLDLDEEVPEFMAQLTFKPSLDDEGSLDPFYDKLKGRRAAIGLSHLGWETSDIAGLLKFQNLRDTDFNAKALINSHLSLSKKINQSKLLVEESDWLRKFIKDYQAFESA